MLGVKLKVNNICKALYSFQKSQLIPFYLNSIKHVMQDKLSTD